jgi:hypothetical protein
LTAPRQVEVAEKNSAKKIEGLMNIHKDSKDRYAETESEAIDPVCYL